MAVPLDPRELGPYDDFAMNALHNTVIASQPYASQLRGMIATARGIGDRDAVRVYRNILGAKLALGEDDSAPVAAPRGAAATALRGE